MTYKKGYHWKNMSLNNIKGEKWMDIHGWKGLYQVSNFCRIKSLRRVVRFKTVKGIHRYITVETRILKPTKNPEGYPSVKLYVNSKKKGYLVHRLVSIEFIPNPSKKTDINHKNGIRDYMALSNFEWCTRGENHTHKYRILHRKHPFIGRTGIKHACSKKVVQLSLSGKVIKVWDGVADVQRKQKFNNISACALGKQKTAHGFKWRYLN